TEFYLLSVCRIELPQLDEQYAPRQRTRRMARCRRIADIATDRKVVMLILKDALEHQKLLTAVMRVSREVTARRVANDGSGAGYLIADAIQHSPLDAGHWRGHPREPRGVDSNAAGKISIDFHLCLLRPGLHHAAERRVVHTQRSAHRC